MGVDKIYSCANATNLSLDMNSIFELISQQNYFEHQNKDFRTILIFVLFCKNDLLHYFLLYFFLYFLKKNNFPTLNIVYN